MLKHGLLDTTEHWAQLLKSPFTPLSLPLHSSFAPLLQRSIAVKERVVEADPHEKGMRKALNLGHTFGHAFESMALNPPPSITHHPSPILHGYAVAYGLICELYLSTVKCGFPIEKMRQTVQYIRENYAADLHFTCDDYPELLHLMQHDKKNVAGTINFTLLADIGDIRLDQTATEAEIREALDFLREGF